MNLKETEAYIENLQSLGSVPGLANIRNLCEELGHPERELRFIHIAGTNGKGSVLSMTASVLKAAGYRCGCYTSPAVFDYRERFLFNGRMMTKKDLCLYMTKMKEACAVLTEQGKPHPTVFEIETAMAFLYFRDKGCELVVLETGMGGEKDATNLVTETLVAAFVSISMDHMQFLGNTLSEIAAEKSGIIKEGAEVVTIGQEAEVMEVLEAACRRLGCPLTIADRAAAGHCKSSLQRQQFDYKEYRRVTIRLPGQYQIENALVALEVIRALNRKGFAVSDQAVYRGMDAAIWPGRFEVIAKKPLFLLDGAHNRDGARRLAESLRFYFTNRRILYIMGMLRDKEREEVLRESCPLAEQILTVSTTGPRGLSAYELAVDASAFHGKVTALDSLEEAVEMSGLLADADTVIVAFGSLSYLGKLKKIVQKKCGEKSHGR